MNKTKQEQRTKRIFIDAAKTILKGEGINAISVRNLAEETGYSYTTLYNYFKDLNEIIHISVSEFAEECIELVKKESSGFSPGKERLLNKTWNYVKYFIQYPGIFQLFFLDKKKDIASGSNSLNLIYNSFQIICQEDWKKIEKNQKNQYLDLLNIKNILNDYIIGRILLYINQRSEMDFLSFQKKIKREHDFLLKDIV